MTQQIITGGNGATGQTNRDVRDIINDNFTQLFRLTGSNNFINVSDATYTITDTDDFINCDCSVNDITLTLPTAVDKLGKKIVIRKADSGDNTITVNTYGSETINSNPTYTIQYGNTVMELQSDNVNWILI